MKNVNLLLFIATFSMFLLSCAPAQVSSGQSDKVAILEQRVVALERQRQKSLADLRSETARMLRKVETEISNFRKSQRFFLEELDTLKKDASLITDDNEKARSDIRKNRIKIQRLVKRLGDQVLALEELKKFFDSSIDSSKTVSAEEKKEFNTIFKQYRKKNFKVASRGFEEFRNRYPESALNPDALFFIAYIHFLTGQYDASTLRFFELIKQYPESGRVNEAKWWLGISLERNGDINGALDLYRELSMLESQNPLKIKADFRIEDLEAKAE